MGGGHRHGRFRRRFLEAPQRLEPAHVRQIVVDDHQIEALGLQPLQRQGAAVHRDDPVTGARQHARFGAHRLAVRIDDQDVGLVFGPKALHDLSCQWQRPVLGSGQHVAKHGQVVVR